MSTRSAIQTNLKRYIMLMALIVIGGFFQLVTGGTLLRPMNVSNLIFQNAYVVILAVGMLLCILSGGNIDLSVGSVVALIGACAGTFIMSWGWNTHLSILVCLLVGILIGVWQGFWIAYVRIPAFIVTLSGMLVFRGLTLLVLNGMTLSPFPPEFLAYSTGFIGDPLAAVQLFGVKNTTCLLLGIAFAVVLCVAQLRGHAARRNKGYAVEPIASVLIKLIVVVGAVIWLFYTLAQYRGMPVVLIALGVILIAYTFVTSRTVMGRHLYALGGNEKAARLSGVKTNKLLFLAYVNMAFLAAVAGIVFAARLNSASPQAGQSFEMDAIGACYIGGASAYGGIGTVGGTLIGALIMGILNNGMSIMGLNSNLQQVVKGLVLLAAVAFDVISKQKVQIPFLSGLFHRRGKTGASV